MLGCSTYSIALVDGEHKSETPKRSKRNNIMLSLRHSILILIVTMFTSLSFMAILNRLWPCERRRHHNDLIGWQLSVLGTTYAVILGFMLYTVWTSFVSATLNADLEANALRNLYRLAEGLPDQRERLVSQSRSYAATVINQDWPAMAHGQLPEPSDDMNEGMWRTLMEIKVASPSETIAEDHALSELSALTAYRRTRLIQSVSRLSIIFWGILLIGAALTLISVITFGSAEPNLHAIQVFSITLLISLTMIAIADVNRPFQGWVCVSVYPFQRALDSMRSD